MALLDMGAEYQCFASDITCSFPASFFSGLSSFCAEGGLACSVMGLYVMFTVWDLMSNKREPIEIEILR